MGSIRRGWNWHWEWCQAQTALPLQLLRCAKIWVFVLRMARLHFRRHWRAWANQRVHREFDIAVRILTSYGWVKDRGTLRGWQRRFATVAWWRYKVPQTGKDLRSVARLNSQKHCCINGLQIGTLARSLLLRSGDPDDLVHADAVPQKGLRHDDSVHFRLLLFIVPWERAPILIQNARTINRSFNLLRCAVVYPEPRRRRWWGWWWRWTFGQGLFSQSQLRFLWMEGK